MKKSLLVLLLAAFASLAFAQNVRQLTGSSGSIAGTANSSTIHSVNLAGQPLVGQSLAGNIVNRSGFTQILQARNSSLDADAPRPELPTQYDFAQNYPNPFNPSTTFEFALPKAGRVTLSLYDILGREVARVLDKNYAAGTHSIPFSAPPELASGMYLAYFEAGSFQRVRKVLLLK